MCVLISGPQPRDDARTREKATKSGNSLFHAVGPQFSDGSLIRHLFPFFSFSGDPAGLLEHLHLECSRGG